MIGLTGLKTKLGYLRFKTTSYSQEGEDCLLQRIFNGQKSGFYVDIGAHHPIRFSNTYLFYKKGWKGLNIDAMPGSMKIFDLMRPKDLNVELAIAETEKEITYYVFNEPALNGFSEDISLDRDNLDNYSIIKKIPLKTHTLKSVLTQHLKEGQEIDFLNIDVEGLDLEVLKSNDWMKFRPKIILAELLCSDLENISENPIFKYLKSQNYSLICKTYNTGFFKRI